MSDFGDNRYNGSIVTNPVANFTEGVFIDYKHFDEQEIEPLYEFGFGKSYSRCVAAPSSSPASSSSLTAASELTSLFDSCSFEVSNVAVKPKSEKVPASVRETNEKLFVDGKEVSGLYDIAYEVTASVKNTGSVAGAEVAQVRPSPSPGLARPRSRAALC